LANNKRNKVRNFGKVSPDLVTAADGFMVGGPYWPPRQNRVKGR